MVPFLIHYLSLGSTRIWIYNNDDNLAWYHHPAVMCLMRDGFVNVQPWFGDNALLAGISHCFSTSIPKPRPQRKDLSNVWGAVFDIGSSFYSFLPMK
jgi:hypothetical protein